MPRKPAPIISINKLIGLYDDEYIFLDYCFGNPRSRGEGPHRGATGYRLSVITEGQHAQDMDLEHAKEHFEEMWRMSVSDGNTTASLSEFTEEALHDGDAHMYDLSYCDYHGVAIAMHDARVQAAAEGSIYPVDADDLGHICSCTAVGRMFAKDGLSRGVTWDEFEMLGPDAPECIALIAKYEQLTIAQEKEKDEQNKIAEAARKKAEAEEAAKPKIIVPVPRKIRGLKLSDFSRKPRKITIEPKAGKNGGTNAITGRSGR